MKKAVLSYILLDSTNLFYWQYIIGSQGRITNSIDSESRCRGSLTIAHVDENQNIKYINLEGRKTRYPNIRRGFEILRDTEILHVQLSGDCCWELYSRRHFTGHKRKILPGEEGMITLDFQPISLKRMECYEQYNSQ